jgi:hypothetical protein
MADDDTAVRTGLAQQLKGRLQAAAEEFKTTAVGESGPIKASGKSPRRARLALSRVDPWSVMKVSFLLSAALAIVTVVAVFIVWSVLGAAGVWDSINSSVHDVVGGQDASSFNILDYVGTSRVMGFTVLISVIDIVLLTAVATLGAFLYNMTAALVGGVDLTLTEER